MNLLLKYYGKKTLKRNVQLTISNIYFDKNIVSMVEDRADEYDSYELYSYSIY